MSAPKSRPTSITIEISQSEIDYDAKRSERAGYLAISDGTPAIGADGDCLLHLLFFLVYTADGRTLLRDHPPSSDAAKLQAVRDDLKANLRRRFTGIADAQLDVVIDAHFAADAYVWAKDANETEQAAQQQAIYQQKLLAILGALHDDAMGKSFSLGW